MLATLFPLVDKKGPTILGTNTKSNTKQAFFINGKYENTLYTCVYQKHEIPVYTVETESKLQTGKYIKQSS